MNVRLEIQSVIDNLVWNNSIWKTVERDIYIKVCGSVGKSAYINMQLFKRLNRIYTDSIIDNLSREMINYEYT
jgi:hypothetical protein